MKTRLSQGSQTVLVSDAVGKNQGVQGRLRFKSAAVLFLANFREHSKTQLDCE